MDKIERRRKFFGDILSKEVIEADTNVDEYLDMDIQHEPKYRREQKRMQRNEAPEISKHKQNRVLKQICKEHHMESDFRRKEWRNGR